MSNGFRSDALNLIGSYSDGCDSDSSDDSESVTPAMEVSEVNISSAGVELEHEEPDRQQSNETVVISDVIMQDEVPHVGMDYTIDSDPPDESTCAQIQLIESQVDCAGNEVDTNASDPVIDEQKWTEKPSMKSASASEVHGQDGSDRTTETTVEILSDHNVQSEANECLETLGGEMLKEEKSCNEDEQSTTKSSMIDETNSCSSQFVSTPKAEPNAEPDDQLNSNQPAFDSALYVGDNSQQHLAREETSEHHGYYGDEHGYDQQYYNQEQQYQYQQYYDQHQYYEEHVPQHGKEQYDSIAQHQQDYVQVQETGTSIQDRQQWHMQSDHHQYMHPGHHQHPQPEQQLYSMSGQDQYSTPPNQHEYLMSEQHHHSQPEQYTQPEQQQYPQPEHYHQPQQQHYSQPEQQQHCPQSEQQQQYPQPEQEQYSQHEQQQHYPQPERQQQYPQPEEQQYSQHEQQQYPQPEQQQYSQPEQQQYSQHEQQQYSQHGQQQYPRPEQQQYSQHEQQQYSQHGQQQYPQPEQQQYSQPEQQQYSQHEQQQYPQPEQQQHSQHGQQHYPQPEQQQYSQPEQQQYSQTDQQQYSEGDQQQYYMQQYYNQQQYSHPNQLADQQQQPYPQQLDQQQQPYSPQQQQYPYPQQPDSQLQHAEHGAVHHLQPGQQQYPSSEQQHGGEYSHTYQEAYAQQQHYSDQHHDHTHGQSYDRQYYDASNKYGHGSYHSSHDHRAHEQSSQYSYPTREGHDTPFEYRQATEHAVDRSGRADYQPYPSHHHSDPHPRPFPPYDYSQREQGRRGNDHERLYPPRGDWEDHRPHHHKWGDNRYTLRDPTHSPSKRDGAGHFSDPRLDSDVRNSPQRNYRISGGLSDPRRKQRDTKDRGTESEEKHYTKSAKYTKISSTVVSRRPAMLKASSVSKASKVKSGGPQIIEPHFASTSPPKTKVSDKGDKSKAPGKLPEATTAKKALANFKIPKHKSSKISSESTTSKPAMKIPALDIPEPSKEECTAEGSLSIAAKVDTSTKKDTTDSQSKSTNVKSAQGKEAKVTKLPTKSMKTLPSNAPTKVLSNLDATTLQALTTIVHQTLKMAANKGMPVAKSITTEMSQLLEVASGHSGETNVTTVASTTAAASSSTATMTSAASSTATKVPSTSTASSRSTNSIDSAIPSSTTATTTTGLQNIPAPTASVAPATTVQEQLVSSPVPPAKASSPTPVKVVSLAAPKAEQAPGISDQQQISTINKGAEKPDSATSVTMTYVLPKAKTIHQPATNASGTKSIPRKSSGVVLATILSGVSSQIKGKSSTVSTAAVSNPSKLDRVLVPHSMSSCPPLTSIRTALQATVNTASTQPTSSSNSVMVERTTQSTSKEADHSSKQSGKKADIKEHDAQAESKKANTTRKSPPMLEYFNADLMLKEYNLRQSGGTASSDESSLKRLQESVWNHGRSSCESSKPNKRERSLESDISSVHKKVKVDTIKGNQENEAVSICDEISHDNEPLPSENLIKHDAKGKSKPSLRRKASVQRRKSRSHKRPQLHGTEAVMSEEHTCEDFLCAFCHQRGGAMNLGFLYGPYKFDPVSIINGVPIDANKESTKEHQREVWVHEDCAVWAPGVCLVGDQLIGLQEAVADGDKMMCEACKRSGATLCCTAHGCKTTYHYPCAQETGCALKEEQFLICCSKHKGTIQS